MEQAINTIETSDWQMIVAQMPLVWREMAEAHRLFPKRFPEHMGTKIKSIEDPLRLVLHHAGTGASLKVTTAAAAAAGIVDISHVGLHKWMVKIGPYLADLCGHMAYDNAVFSSERWAGYEVMTVDASALACPGAKGTTARVHYAVRLVDLHPVEIQVTDYTGGETYRRFEVVSEQLWIGDRGYANPPGIAFIDDSGAKVLVRHNYGSLPLYNGAGLPFDVRGKIASLKKPGTVREWNVWVHPQNHEPIWGRLCAIRLPDDKAQEAQNRVRREHGKSVTPAMLEAAKYVVVFTTVPSSDLDTGKILELYRLRWQVELFIKRDKSIGDLDELPNFKPETIYSWICAKTLLLLIARKIVSAGVSFPPSAK
jgi:Transposase DDE domain